VATRAQLFGPSGISGVRSRRVKDTT